MRFTVTFRDGEVSGEALTPSEIAGIDSLRDCWLRHSDFLSVGLSKDRHRTVGDIVAMTIDGVEVTR